MKATVKIVILLLAITLAIGGVLIYAKTIVDPPDPPTLINQYEADIQNNYEHLSKNKDELKTDSIYAIIIDRISIYKAEDKITSSVAQENLDRFIKLFAEYSFAKFENSVWSDNDHNNMLARINELNSLIYSDKTIELSKAKIDSLNLISKVIADYRQARVVSRNTLFTGITGISDAKTVINQAKKYANDKHLSNCTELLNSLNSVRSKIAQSHYGYVADLVNRLNAPNNYRKDFYIDTLIPVVENAIKEYDSNANALYGSKIDLSPLISKAESFIKDAICYYQNND